MAIALVASDERMGKDTEHLSRAFHLSKHLNFIFPLAFSTHILLQLDSCLFSSEKKSSLAGMRNQECGNSYIACMCG